MYSITITLNVAQWNLQTNYKGECGSEYYWIELQYYNTVNMSDKSDIRLTMSQSTTQGLRVWAQIANFGNVISYDICC